MNRTNNFPVAVLDELSSVQGDEEGWQGGTTAYSWEISQAGP